MAHEPGTIPSRKQRPRVPHKRHANWVSDAYSSVMTTVSGRRHATPHPARAAAETAPMPVGQEHDDEEPHHGIPGFLEYCWPAVFGILLAIISTHLRQKILLDWGEVGDRLFFPFVQLAGRPEFGFGDQLSQSLPPLIQLIQFPVYGFYASFAMSRHHRFSIILAQIVFVSLIASFVLWILSRPGASHGM